MIVQQLRAAFLMLLAMTLLTGGIYPLAVTAVAQFFPREAGGSLIRDGQRVLGSELIGQPFSKPGYFWGRLSATSPFPYNAAVSSGSNFGPLHPGLKSSAEARVAALRGDEVAAELIPIDLVTASGSGLDPHISEAAADFQVARVAESRQLSPDAVRKLVHQYTQPRQFGILGESRVNVLRLNLALDRLQDKQ